MNIGASLCVLLSCTQLCGDSSNSATIDSYNAAVEKYISGTPTIVDGGVKLWIDKMLTLLPPQARIMEIGSGFGRDAHYIESCGFAVERTDATQGFVTLLQRQGHPARLFNIITDPFAQKYDLIFANAVLLHCTGQEFADAINKISSSLVPGGILAFSMKYGTGEEWVTAKLDLPRYFCYWQPDEITKVLQVANFEVIEILDDGRFFDVIARRL
jgi:SAM-dependent methyltransferase